MLIFLAAAAISQGKVYNCNFYKVEPGNENSSVVCELKSVKFSERNHFGLKSNKTTLEYLAGIVEDYIEDDKINDYVEQFKFKESKLSSIPNIIFQIFDKLQVFDATNTELKYINAKSFKSTENLLKMFLHNNRLTTIDNFSFSGTKKLETLDLSSNIIVKVHSRAFASLDSLIDLNLSNNKISSFDDETFQNLLNLKWLGLDHNQLTMIASTLFTKNHGNLEGISLNFNNIKEISPNVFDNLKSLRFLMLAGNKCVNKSFNNHVIQENTSIKMELNQCHKNYRKVFPLDDEKFNITMNLDRLEKSREICNYEFTSVNESVTNIHQQLEKLVQV